MTSESRIAAGVEGESATDLIAMASHWRSGLARVLIGNVADKVVRASEIPVLVYRPKAKRQNLASSSA